MTNELLDQPAEKTEKTHPFMKIEKLKGKQATMGEMQAKINELLDYLQTMRRGEV